MKTIAFFGKTSDNFCMIIKTDQNEIIKEVQDYPPIFLGYDGISLEVDIETGQILNWDSIKVKAELQEIIEGV